ncbi:ileal sodium/bile acid cotransporter-like [Antedon mediterranea]|uniref:ileal sodium/bile acid cotransporter-like n=1 Tax=Antedon mediterranea TaxID=105859 RepID=UPI003AF48BC5
MEGSIYCALVFCLLFGLSTQSNSSIGFTITPDDFLLVTEGEIANVNINISNIEQTNITIVNIDEDIFQVIPDDNDDQTLVMENGDIPILGLRLGIGTIRILLTFPDGESEINYQVKVLRKSSVLDYAFTYTLLSWMIVSYVTMGTKMDLKIIWGKLRRPYAVVTGIVCQFLIMPVLAFAVANIVSLEKEETVGLLVDGSCPGGWLSNVFTLLLDCDFVLSLTMTFCSSILALGMMPLNMMLYTKPFVEEGDSLETPYAALTMQLALMLIPVGIGIVILYKFTKLADLCVKLLKPFAFGLIVIAFSLGVPSQMFIFSSSWRVYTAAAIFPLIGGITGFTIATVTRRKTPEALTIAFETGVQNSLLATTMAKLSYPQPEADLVCRVPLLIAILTMIEGTIIVFIYVISQHLSKRAYQPVNEEPNELKSKEAEENGRHNGWTKLPQVSENSRKIYIGNDFSSDDHKTKEDTKSADCENELTPMTVPSKDCIEGPEDV